MVLSIIFLVLFAACTGISIYFVVNLVKSPMVQVNYKKELVKPAIFDAGAVIAFIVASFGFYSWLKATPDALHAIQLVIGAIIFIGCFLVATNCFILHYYGKNIPALLDKWLFRIQLICFTVSLVGFFIWTNGLAPYLSYPLINGINFTHGAVTPATYEGSVHITPNLAFYAMCILGGAILVYFICDHYMYKEYGKHGILESTFFVAFPAGIIGARIAYVMGEWSTKFDNGHAMTEAFGMKIWAPLAIWEGGITILGGAIGGILVGVLWYLWRNKGKSIWIAFDMALPTILIAQAVGRWGNYFNCEVHGMEVSVEGWKWLPEIIWRNSIYSSELGFAQEGNIYVPLFIIEGVVNMLGFFILAHVFGKALRKYSELGDIGFGYIIWYGLTRMFMEPLRHPAFQMGAKGYWSWIWSMVFVVAGTLAIVINHIVRAHLRKQAGTFAVHSYSKKVGLISSIALVAVAVACLALGISFLSGSKFVEIVAYNNFNLGVIFMVLGVSFASCLGISVPMLVDGIKKGNETINA